MKLLKRQLLEEDSVFPELVGDLWLRTQLLVAETQAEKKKVQGNFKSKINHRNFKVLRKVKESLKFKEITEVLKFKQI